MKYAFSLLLACTALGSAPAFAQAAPTAEDIAALRAQIQALQTQLNALQAAQQAQAAQVAKVEAAAAVPAPVPVPPAKKEAPGWFANTSISGKAFLNVSDINQKSTDLAGNTTDNVLSGGGSPNGTQAEIKRFYVGVDHKFNDTFSANVTTDFRYGTNGTSKDVLVFIKKAYLQAKLDPAFNVRVGESDLAWVPFVEGLYGYRFIENVLIDRTKFGTSTDWGVHLFGSFADNLVSYQLSAINGAGFKTLSRTSNTIDLEGRVSVNPIKPITIAVGGYTGKLGKSNDAVSVNHRATRFDALVAYTDKRVRAGVEYYHAKNWFNVQTAVEPAPAPGTPNDSGHGWSAFGSFAFTPEISIFARYDWVKPTELRITGVTGDVKDQYFNAGVDYKPIPPIDLALVYKHEHAENGFINTSNGNIGGLDHGKYSEIGVFGQLVF